LAAVGLELHLDKTRADAARNCGMHRTLMIEVGMCAVLVDMQIGDQAVGIHAASLDRHGVRVVYRAGDAGFRSGVAPANR